MRLKQAWILVSEGRGRGYINLTTGKSGISTLYSHYAFLEAEDDVYAILIKPNLLYVWHNLMVF